MTSGESRLEAPHRRASAGERRIVERSAVLAYRAAERLLSVVPERPARGVIGLGAQASYLLWPEKRRWSNQNFGHVLGLPPDHPRVRRLALRAYAEYGRYLVELMRLPSRPRMRSRRSSTSTGTASTTSGTATATGGDPRGGLILVVDPHGQQRGGRRPSIARHGMPISVVADDTAFPELFDISVASARRMGRRRSSRGATSAGSSACSGGRDAGAARRLGLPAPTGSRSASSAPGRRCPPAGDARREDRRA